MLQISPERLVNACKCRLVCSLRGIHAEENQEVISRHEIGHFEFIDVIFIVRAFIFNRLDRQDEARSELAAFDELAEPPADMVSLIDQFGLREALA